MTRIDEFSRLLGSLEEAIKGLTRSLDLDRKLANDRHQENVGNFQLLDGRMDSLESTVAPLKKTVDRMEPIVKSVEIRGWKRAGAISLASAIVAFLAWAIIEFFGKAGTWLLSLFHR